MAFCQGLTEAPGAKVDWYTPWEVDCLIGGESMFEEYGSDLRDAIVSWRPRQCVVEKDYENSLATRLRREFPSVAVEQQYGSGRQRVDIAVNDDLAIEIKCSLKSQSAIHRTRGQISQYVEDRRWHRIFIVLCGDTSREAVLTSRTMRSSSGTLLVIR